MLETDKYLLIMMLLLLYSQHLNLPILFKVVFVIQNSAPFFLIIILNNKNAI